MFVNRRLRIIRIDFYECTNDERIVVLFAKQEQLGQVAVDREVVIAGTTENRGRVADSVYSSNLE